MTKIVQIIGQENMSDKFNKKYFRTTILSFFFIATLDTRARMESVRSWGNLRSHSKYAAGSGLQHRTSNSQASSFHHSSSARVRYLACYSNFMHSSALDLCIPKLLLFPQ